MSNRLPIAVSVAFLLATGSAHAQSTAIAKLETAGGQSAGTVMLRQTPNGVHVLIDVQNLPAGIHGFHVHETGQCQPDFKAAGGHYAPAGKKYGFYTEGGPHAGDLPNIHVSQSGAVRVEYFAPGLSLEKNAKNTVLDEDGSAIIIHAQPDDYTSQPAGDAGDRITCGVIESTTQSASQ